MSGPTSHPPPTTAVTPALAVADPGAAYWIRRVTLHLRREICWCWHQRRDGAAPEPGVLPPLQDAAAENLDAVRVEGLKRIFFASDVTAGYLTGEIERLGDPPNGTGRTGCWGRTINLLELDEAAQFVLALALTARLDAGLAPIIASCMNDHARPYPTLALAQRLWDDPMAIVACADPTHPLHRFRLLSDGGQPAARVDWHHPLEMPAVIARALLEPEWAGPNGVSQLPSKDLPELDRSGEILVAGFIAEEAAAMRVTPLIGAPGVTFERWAAAVARRIGRPAIALPDYLANSPAELSAVAVFAWMRGRDVLLPEGWMDREAAAAARAALAELDAIPVRWYAPMHGRRDLAELPPGTVTPPLAVASLSFTQRAERIRRGLGRRARRLDVAIEECARRFRFQEQFIERLTRTFADRATELSESSLLMAARHQASVELGSLAQFVTPRFGPDDIVLPIVQRRQFEEISQAMRNLTRAHYRWGTAKVWNEAGLSILFCGTPGTGKTMAAEALSSALELPMYRIDLSQVVNKYIGETEKNLKRIFDTAELSDCILFFDEADALFGKRTDVKDAHDRFANIEISYLLERMERFKGLAILATNRRKDLDDAFMRRLRYIVEFPIPGVSERERIWRKVFPPRVDLSDLDFPYLARQFQLTGGHIRSIAFNACLQSAGAEATAAADAPWVGKVSMDVLLVAVKRELEKMNRAASDELFGSYRHAVKELVA